MQDQNKPQISYAADIIEYSRNTYGKARLEVEEETKEWYKAIIPPKVESAINYNVSGNSQSRDYTGNSNYQNQGENKNYKGNNTHTRSRHDNYKKEKDIRDVELSDVRRETEKIKTETGTQNTSLKDALAKAMNEEKSRREILNADKNDTKIEDKIEEKIVQEKKEIKEISEKVLRDLVAEE